MGNTSSSVESWAVKKKTKRAAITGEPAVDLFGKRLTLLLAERGWHATRLAQEAQVSLPTVTRALKEERLVTVATLVKFARAMELSVDELLGLNMRTSAVRPQATSEDVTGVHPKHHRKSTTR